MTDDLLRLRQAQTEKIMLTRKSGSLAARLAPIRDQLKTLIAQEVQPSVRQIQEILGAAGYAASRPSIAKYLKREFDWESPLSKKDVSKPKKIKPQHTENTLEEKTSKPIIPTTTTTTTPNQKVKAKPKVDTSALFDTLKANSESQEH